MLTLVTTLLGKFSLLSMMIDKEDENLDKDELKEGTNVDESLELDLYVNSTSTF